MYIQRYNAHGLRLSTTHTLSYAKCDRHINECTLFVHSMLVHVHLFHVLSSILVHVYHGGLLNNDHHSDPRQIFLIILFWEEVAVWGTIFPYL